jgi:hypothetical protein
MVSTRKKKKKKKKKKRTLHDDLSHLVLLRLAASVAAQALLGVLQGTLGGVALDQLDDALLVRGEAGDLANQSADVGDALAQALRSN